MSCSRMLAGVAILAVSSFAYAQIGPDVMVWDLYNTAHYGPVSNVHAYAVGTESCNIGDQNALWQSWNNLHPVIGAGLYRLNDGRLEQLSLSWLKHGFVTIDTGNCGNCTQTGSVLGVGCADPYSAGLNGDRSNNGPRYQVNATTGVFTYPYDDSGPVNNALSRRIQAHDDLINPALNSGALYFVEGQYVTQDDAAAGNANNNTSYRRVTFSSASGRAMTLRESTHQMTPVLQAWRDHGNGVNTPDFNVNMTKIDVSGDGRFWAAHTVTDNGDGTWHYEYAIQNLNSHRSGGGLRIPIEPGTSLTNVGFHDVNYHSGEPFDNTDWGWAEGAGEVVWSSPQSHAENANSNALRWGTTYNFWFDANAAPVNGAGTVDLFRPGSPSSVNFTARVPGTPVTAPCPGDLDGNGFVELADLSIQLANFGTASGATEEDGDMDADGDVDLTDLSLMLALFGTAC